ncbi:MAG: sulfite exporter TauE/SafE family protein [Bradyrhizobiaceae bacterium]|nr:MAG: sulfite exporter TauE/SafE family protein [Bradyrhizobiaceae bacterium]
MTSSLFIIVAAGAVVAGFVQGLSGFAFGLVAMSLWAWFIEPRLAAAMVVLGSFAGQLLAVFSVRRGFNLRLLLPFLIGGLAGVPVGTLLLPYLDIDLFKLLLGLLLVLWCPAMLMSSQLPRVHAGPAADGAVGFLGGILGGIGGYTGAIPTLWCTLRGLEKDTQRAIIQNFNLGILSVTLLVYIATGLITVQMLPVFAVLIPAMLIPAFLGTRLYIGISEATFRRIVLGLLTASGVALLASALSHYLSRG